MRIIPWDGSEEHYLDFGEPTYFDAGFGDNDELDTAVLRYQYTSLTTPDSVFDYDMATQGEDAAQRRRDSRWISTRRTT